jgi:hypothetical protein
LVAEFSLLFPLRNAPVIFNLFALLFKLAPLSILLSARASTLAGLPTRLFFGLLYVCLPNSFEIHMNITNCQWHLALLSFLVLVLPRKDGASWRIFDWTVILIGGLSGPFCLLLAPIAWCLWWKDRLGVSRALAVSGCAAVQTGAFFLLQGVSRTIDPSGASVSAFSRIIGGQVVVGSLLGQRATESLNAYPVLAPAIFFTLTIGALFAFCMVALKGTFEHKLFVLYAALILGATLRTSTGNGGMPSWPSLGTAGMGGRYWFVPMLAFLVTLVWLAGGGHKSAIRISAAALLLLFPIGAFLDWRYRPFEDLHWTDFATKVRSSPPGGSVVTPINPPGWTVTLSTHTPSDRRPYVTLP